MTTLEIRGGASPEEIAAVLAVVSGRTRPRREDPLGRWRRLRQSVTKPT